MLLLTWMHYEYEVSLNANKNICVCTGRVCVFVYRKIFPNSIVSTVDCIKSIYCCCAPSSSLFMAYMCVCMWRSVMCVECMLCMLPCLLYIIIRSSFSVIVSSATDATTATIDRFKNTWSMNRNALALIFMDNTVWVLRCREIFYDVSHISHTLYHIHKCAHFSYRLNCPDARWRSIEFEIGVFNKLMNHIFL